MKRIIYALLFSIISTSALSQSGCPTIAYGAVLTPAQWQSCFSAKQDYLNFVPLNKAGDAMNGRLVTIAPLANVSGFNLTPGTTPSAPIDGDIWATTIGIFGRVSGSTVPLGGGASFADPTASVGLSAVNGTALTAMRSDAAPAINLAISPTMTGPWIFSNGTASSSTSTGAVTIPNGGLGVGGNVNVGGALSASSISGPLGSAASFGAVKVDGTTIIASGGVISVAGGAADVVGPASSTDNAAARYDTTTGKLIQNSSLIISDTTGALSRTGGGGIPLQGTNTNDDASAGEVGEYISSSVLSGSAVSLTSSSPTQVTSIPLTAGDWDVSGTVAFLNPGTTTVTDSIAAINTAVSLPTIGAENSIVRMNTSAITSSQVLGIGPTRIKLSAPANIYLVAQANFSVSTLKAYGFIGARRAR